MSAMFTSVHAVVLGTTKYSWHLLFFPFNVTHIIDGVIKVSKSISYLKVLANDNKSAWTSWPNFCLTSSTLSKVLEVWVGSGLTTVRSLLSAWYFSSFILYYVSIVIGQNYQFPKHGHNKSDKYKILNNSPDYPNAWNITMSIKKYFMLVVFLI